MGTATTTPQINNLIGRVRKISVLHEWHALMNKSVPSSQQREITMFTVLMTTWAYNCTALILYFHEAHTNPVIVYFAEIIEHEQDGTTTNRGRCLFPSDVFLAVCRRRCQSSLSSLLLRRRWLKHITTDVFPNWENLSRFNRFASSL